MHSTVAVVDANGDGYSPVPCYDWRIALKHKGQRHIVAFIRLHRAAAADVGSASIVHSIKGHISNKFQCGFP